MHLTPQHPPPSPVLQDIQALINAARERVAGRVNEEITRLYWQVGKRVHLEVLQGERAEYGRQLLAALSQSLMVQYGHGWSEPHLRQCVQLAQAFDDEQILYTVCTELSWSHIRSLMYIDEPLKREFYIEICKLERWSARQLQERIKSMLFERSAISKKPEQTIQNDLKLLRTEGKLSADLAFRDPYVLDFLGLKDNYSERDLESAIVADLQTFITEMGSDFAFLARQKRLTIDG
jgi:predicted nuclease of restriction endonuclease-like (RecB) superfamily